MEDEILRSADERFAQDDNAFWDMTTRFFSRRASAFLCANFFYVLRTNNSPRAFIRRPYPLSGGVAVLFVFDPFANEVWAGHDAEDAVLAVRQIGQRGAVEFFQVRQVE